MALQSNNRIAAAMVMASFILLLTNLSSPSLYYAYAFTFPTSSSQYFAPRKSWSCLPRQHKWRPAASASALFAMSSSHIATTTEIPSLISANIQRSHDRNTAQQMVDRTLCPPNEERDRNTAGMEAYGNGDNDSGSGVGGQAITNDDPRSEYTYGEFPFDSFDLLVDRALDFVKNNDPVQNQNSGSRVENTGHQYGHQTMVDLGSGCGRLVFYAALTRGGNGGGEKGVSPESESKLWNVHGVEIGTQLHSLAVNSLQRGIDQGWFLESSSSSSSSSTKEEELEVEVECNNNESGMITFHNGNALLVEDPYYANPQQPASATSSIQSLLSKTNILFAYSTVWETNSAQPFDPELQAMILSPKWSSTLASLCSNGCVAITTDRALNPEDGWRLVDRMEVENPSVWGSVGYISVLEK